MENFKNFIKLNPLRKDWQNNLNWYNFDYKFIMPWWWMSQGNRHFSWQNQANLLVIVKYNFLVAFSVYGSEAFKFEAISALHITTDWRSVILKYASCRCGPPCVSPCCRWNNLERQSYGFQQVFSQILAEKIEHFQGLLPSLCTSATGFLFDRVRAVWHCFSFVQGLSKHVWKKVSEGNACMLLDHLELPSQCSCLSCSVPYARPGLLYCLWVLFNCMRVYLLPTVNRSSSL